jgi:hypothetical protein
VIKDKRTRRRFTYTICKKRYEGNPVYLYYFSPIFSRLRIIKYISTSMGIFIKSRAMYKVCYDNNCIAYAKFKCDEA